MPLRRSFVHALDVVTTTGEAGRIGAVRLELHVSSGTYVRAIAQALGGHCTALRRTAVGPFSVDEAAADRRPGELMPVGEALARLPAEAVERVPAGVRAGVLAAAGDEGEGPPA